jgi:hypothetical protein
MPFWRLSLSAAQVTVCGEPRPKTLAEFYAAVEGTDGDYERGEGRCVMLYDLAGDPADVAFWGCSGD